MAGILDTLIFDRTQLDINRARYLNSLWDARAQRWTGTKAEWNEWEAGPRGAYGWRDMNRVTDAVSYLIGHLSALGYAVDMKNITPAYNVTVIAFPLLGGTVTGSGVYYEDDTATVTAEVNEKYDFVGWMQGGELVSTDLTYTFTVEQSVTLTATFALKQFSVEVSVEPVEGGDATGSGTYDIDTEVTVAATADDNYVFTRWTENGQEVATGADYTFTLTENRVLTAVMTRVYVITLTTNDDDFGAATGGGTYLDGQDVTLVATAADGYTFIAWESNDVVISNDPIYTFAPTDNMEIVAVFEEEQQAVQLDYDYSGQVETAILVPGVYKLEVWGAEGGYRSSATYAGKGGYSVGTLTVTENTTIFSRAGGSGNTGGTDGGFNGGGKRNTYNGGGGASDIRIGVDDLNYRVIVAGGGGSDGGTNKSGKYGGGLSGGDVGSSGSTNGYGTGGYGGTQTGNSGGASWLTVVEKTGTTSDSDTYSGFGFGGNGIFKSSGYGGAGGGGWYGGTGRVPDSSGDDDGGGGGGSGYVWTVDTSASAPTGFGLEAKHYLAEAQTIGGDQPFQSPDGVQETGHTGNGYCRITPLISYAVTVLSDNEDYGTVSGGGLFMFGAEITISATANSGYVFTGWYTTSGNLVSTDNPYTFTVDSKTTLVAKFREAQIVEITVSSNDESMGTATGSGTYYEGEQVTISATAEKGYRFVHWEENF